MVRGFLEYHIVAALFRNESTPVVTMTPPLAPQGQHPMVVARRFQPVKGRSADCPFGTDVRRYSAVLDSGARLEATSGRFPISLAEPYPWPADASVTATLGLAVQRDDATDGHVPQVLVARAMAPLPALCSCGPEGVVAVLVDPSLVEEETHTEVFREALDRIPGEAVKGYIVFRMALDAPQLPIRFARRTTSAIPENMELLSKLVAGQVDATLDWFAGGDLPVEQLLPETRRVYATTFPGFIDTPAWAFTDLRHVTEPQEGAVVAYLDIALASKGLTARDFEQASHLVVDGAVPFDERQYEAACVLGQACTLLANCLYYTPDVSTTLQRGWPIVGSPTTRTILVERPGDPLAHTEHGGDGDCEDTNRLAVFLFWWIRNRSNSRNPLLRAARRMAQAWVPFVVLMSCVGDALDNSEEGLPRLEETQRGAGAHMGGICLTTQQCLDMLRPLYPQMRELPEGLAPQAGVLTDGPHARKLPPLALEGTGPMSPIFMPFDLALPPQEGARYATDTFAAQRRCFSWRAEQVGERGAWSRWAEAMRTHRILRFKSESVDRGHVVNGFYRILCTLFYPEPATYRTTRGEEFSFRQVELVSRRSLDDAVGMYRGATFYDVTAKSTDLAMVLMPQPSQALDEFVDSVSRNARPFSCISVSASPPFLERIRILEAFIDDSVVKTHAQEKRAVFVQKRPGTRVVNMFLRYHDIVPRVLDNAFGDLGANPYVEAFSAHIHVLYEGVAQLDICARVDVSV